MGATDDISPQSWHARQLESESAKPDPTITRTVDTEVTSRTAPAVVHEVVQPEVHEIVQKRITREIHNHHIYRRTLPVLETEILPSRHFLESSDGGRLVEASENEVKKITGLPVRDWIVLPRSSLTESHVQYNGRQNPTHVPEDRLEQGSGLLDIDTEPILMDKRAYVTEDGIFRTEYLWRHPPVFEDVHGRTVPVGRISAGISDDWRRIMKESKRDRAHSEEWDRADKNDVRPNNTRADRVNIGGSAQTTSSNGGHIQSQDVGSHVVPAKVEPLAGPEHQGLAIRTRAGVGSTTQNGGTPDLARKESLQNLKGGEKTTAALSEEENSRLRKETEEQARRQFLQTGSNNKTELSAV
ncbi:hypothetical protein VPNG_08234 [Cytospora leucostoma]|uniref:Uncharacterized protein n=1 Tax=Cytospora leucostoma TaxID=1230097 RepID=A0A423W781_9PEZI|nr:hypothetical protein VPNG_08234 [Cytospora leucostoma]